MNLENIDLVLRIIVQSLLLIVIFGFGVFVLTLIFTLKSIKAQIDKLDIRVNKIIDNVTNVSNLFGFKDELSGAIDKTVLNKIIRFIKKTFFSNSEGKKYKSE